MDKTRLIGILVGLIFLLFLVFIRLYFLDRKETESLEMAFENNLRKEPPRKY